jgi:hypothetical protein
MSSPIRFKYVLNLIGIRGSTGSGPICFRNFWQEDFRVLNIWNVIQSKFFKRIFSSIFFISQDIRVSETATPNADVDEISKVACK